MIGVRSFDQIPCYLHNADVGLIPFDVEGHPELVHAIHPLKLYEYLACGLPVVATRWHELEALGSPALLFDGVTDFTTRVRQALSGQPDADIGRAFARRADWSARVDTLLAALGMNTL